MTTTSRSGATACKMQNVPNDVEACGPGRIGRQKGVSQLGRVHHEGPRQTEALRQVLRLPHTLAKGGGLRHPTAGDVMVQTINKDGTELC